MSHKLADEIRNAMKEIQPIPLTANFKTFRKLVLEACGYLDRMADRQSAGGKAAAGNSGRKKLVFDMEKAKQLRAEGMTNRAIAEKLGVSDMTVKRRLG